MSYVKTNWQTGDVVAAEKLNNIENGIGYLYGEKEGEFDITFTINEDGTEIISSSLTINELKELLPNGSNSHKYANVTITDGVTENHLVMLASSAWTSATSLSEVRFKESTNIILDTALAVTDPLGNETFPVEILKITYYWDSSFEINWGEYMLTLSQGFVDGGVKVYFDEADAKAVRTPYKDQYCNEEWDDVSHFMGDMLGQNVQLFSVSDGNILNQYTPSMIGEVDRQDYPWSVGIVYTDLSVARGWTVVGFDLSSPGAPGEDIAS